MRNSDSEKKKITMNVVKHWNQFPERPWDLCHLRYSELNWRSLWAACCNGTCSEQEGWTKWRVFQPLACGLATGCITCGGLALAGQTSTYFLLSRTDESTYRGGLTMMRKHWLKMTAKKTNKGKYLPAWELLAWELGLGTQPGNQGHTWGVQLISL